MAGVRRVVVLLCLVLILLCCQVSGQNGRTKSLHKMKMAHKPKILSQNKLAKIAGLTDIDRFKGHQVLDPLLRVRVPGTTGNADVRKFIVSTLQNLGSWDVEENSFYDTTPYETVNFVNIIATLRNQDSTPSDLKLVLACHYDSKFFQEFEFVGATDSAVPCAMLLDLAHNLKASLDAKTYMPYTLQLIFFDGEEAFVQWTPGDSIYGSRHLAQKWQKTPHQSVSNQNALDGIGLFVLLDLIGTANPTFRNFFKDNPLSDGTFRHLQRIERRLSQSGQLASYDSSRPYFTSSSPYSGGIEDDHIPFLRRGVDIVHVITSPFPSVWHKASDKKSALHWDTISNLNKIFHVFVVEFLHLQPPLE